MSAIVLAGGRSLRFGRDKLAEPLDGVSVLDRTVTAVRAVADDIVVVVAPGPDQALPDGVRIARDAAEGQGPLVGVVAGLEAVGRDRVLIVGGDMPWLVAEVLQALVDALDPARDAAALEADGRLQQLPLAVRREPGLAAARVLVAAGTRRLGALPDVLDVARIAEPRWRALDPEGATLLDIDEPGDLPPG